LGASRERCFVGGMAFIEMHGPDNDLVVLDGDTVAVA
jgi:hypothetical protein